MPGGPTLGGPRGTLKAGILEALLAGCCLIGTNWRNVSDCHRNQLTMEATDGRATITYVCQNNNGFTFDIAFGTS